MLFLMLILCVLTFVTGLDVQPVCVDESSESLSQLRQSKKYLLYDINPGEGFNLRRDVYIRAANLARKLRIRGDDWLLVLPPWGPLYHWKSKWLDEQAKIPWAQFFDLNSLNQFVPVVELTDFMKDVDRIDMIYVLQYFSDTFEDGHEWVDKYALGGCLSKPLYRFRQDKLVGGWFWGYGESLTAFNFSCLSLQGQVSTLIPLLQSNTGRSVMLDRAEIMLHDNYGDVEYWMARRSMRYSSKLIDVGNQFRAQFLNSTDIADGTVQEDHWMDIHSSPRNVSGGPYVAVHLRRGDFLYGRNRTVPGLKFAAMQIDKIMKRLNLSLAFISTDASKSEFEELKSWLPRAVRHVPSSKLLRQLLDGGIAIVDQWICAHARYFVGTYESTFSFRIQEDREILGFHPDTTFNRLCGDSEGDECEQPARWKIVY